MELIELVEKVPEVSPDDTLESVRSVMREAKANFTVVVRGRTILGLITEADLARPDLAPAAGGAHHAHEAMTTLVETMPSSTSVIDAVEAMRTRKFQVLGLIDDAGDFVGLVSLRRAMFEVMDELGMKVDNLERELMADGPGG
jgi:CBS domain-containing protein